VDLEPASDFIYGQACCCPQDDADPVSHATFRLPGSFQGTQNLFIFAAQADLIK
jgi:hypothetical protein